MSNGWASSYRWAWNTYVWTSLKQLAMGIQNWLPTPLVMGIHSAAPVGDQWGALFLVWQDDSHLRLLSLRLLNPAVEETQEQHIQESACICLINLQKIKRFSQMGFTHREKTNRLKQIQVGVYDLKAQAPTRELSLKKHLLYMHEFCAKGCNCVTREDQSSRSP